eukprot:4767314-Prymnesium_polylepis.1
MIELASGCAAEVEEHLDELRAISKAEHMASSASLLAKTSLPFGASSAQAWSEGDLVEPAPKGDPG